MANQNDYNNEPIFYCKQCLSLKVLGNQGLDFCDECGCTDIGECLIEEWESMYEKKYGYKYINNKK